jgi:polyisoprenoid-binding protein YceI
MNNNLNTIKNSSSKKINIMATYVVDAMHSEVNFKVKHLMISTVTGNFAKYDATLTSTADDFSDAVINFSADINSISTGNEQRDTHLKGADFFDAATYPALTFESTAFSKNADGTYTLIGNLTVKNVTKTVELAVEYGGTMTDFYGQTKAGFEIAGKINRKEFGLTWDAVTEAGGVVVSDEVRLQFNIQMVKQA